MLVHQLSAAGWCVVGVHSPLRALELASRGHFHAAIVDLNMPGLDGVEWMRELRRQNQQLPIVLLSHGASAPEEFKKTEAFCVLKKPYRPGEVEAVVEDALFAASAPHAFEGSCVA